MDKFDLMAKNDYDRIIHLVNVPFMIEEAMKKLRENLIFGIDQYSYLYWAYGYITGENPETEKKINEYVRRGILEGTMTVRKVEGLRDLINLISGLNFDELKNEMAGHLSKLYDLQDLYIVLPVNEESEEDEKTGISAEEFNKYFKKPEVIPEVIPEEEEDEIDKEYAKKYLTKKIMELGKKYREEQISFIENGGDGSKLTSYSKYKYEHYQMTYKYLFGDYYKLYDIQHIYMEKDPQSFDLYSNKETIKKILKECYEKEEDEIETPKSDVAIKGGACGGEKTAKEKFEEQSKEQE